MHLGKGWAQPLAVVVIGDGPALAMAITRDIGRIGQDEIDAVIIAGVHHIDAVDIEHHVAGAVGGP